jgi:SAM-dependent methyltransferase
MDPREHWDRVYVTRLATELSWYQRTPRRSLALIQDTGVASTASILDVGGGDSTLIDHLIADGYGGASVLDLSGAALRRARARLGPEGDAVVWREADVLTADLAPASVDVWHDRAVFHFLTRPEDRAAYVEQVRRAVRPHGHVIVATFAQDGPTRCTGLPVERYSTDSLRAVFGAGFQLETSVLETHWTPGGAKQSFVYCWFKVE